MTIRSTGKFVSNDYFVDESELDLPLSGINGMLFVLPVELLLSIFRRLDQHGLASLCRTCRFLNHLILETGWKDFCRTRHRSTPSNAQLWSTLTWRERARDAHLTNKGWSSHIFAARTLNTRWTHKYQPVIALSSTRLVVGAGGVLTSYRFGYKNGPANAITRSGRSSVVFEGNYEVFPRSPSYDITGVVFLPDGGKNETLVVSNISGELVRVRLPPPSPSAENTKSYSITRPRGSERGGPLQPVTRTAKYIIGTDIRDKSIKALAAAGSSVLAVTSTGYASIIPAASPWLSPSAIQAARSGARAAWSAHLEPSANTPYAAVGTNSNVTVYPLMHSASSIRGGGGGGTLSSEPMAVLTSPGKSTPVYTIGQFLPGGSPDLIATGWFDGKVRIFDLRSASRSGFGNRDDLEFVADGPAPLNPVLTLSDPWRSFDPIYSLAARAEMSDHQARGEGLPHQYHYLAAGSALHSVVCLWDVRRTSTGWSVYAPGGDRSPVYALRAEGSRVWGATQWRAFVLDFGPEAKDTIWPRVEDVAMDGLDNGPPTYLHFSERYDAR